MFCIFNYNFIPDSLFNLKSILYNKLKRVLSECYYNFKIVVTSLFSTASKNDAIAPFFRYGIKMKIIFIIKVSNVIFSVKNDFKVYIYTILSIDYIFARLNLHRFPLSSVPKVCTRIVYSYTASTPTYIIRA